MQKSKQTDLDALLHLLQDLLAAAVHIQNLVVSLGHLRGSRGCFDLDGRLG